MDELIRMTATEVVDRLRRRDITPLEVVDTLARRIEAVDGQVNAIPTRCFERARQQARSMVQQRSEHGERRGWLAGLPVPIKDNNDVGGVVTTQGSPIFADQVPGKSDNTVATLEASGAIPIGKTNIPEFAGANTFNTVFGATRNPWDLRMSVSGSSGGAAAALASGQAWLANGNDLGGSLRQPASFCGVLGLRPSPGRVPRKEAALPFDPLWVEGPMARNVPDLALMFDAMCAEHPDDPLSMPPPARPWVEAVRSPMAPRRVAFSPDLGIVPVEPEIQAICREAASRHFAEIGVVVDEACPDFTGALDCFQTLRATLVAAALGDLLPNQRNRIKPDIVWNIEKGLKQTADDVIRAERTRRALYHRVSAFFETYDLLVCPATPLAPFPVETNYPEIIAGVKSETYIDWIGICFAVTLTSCPVVAIPAGLTATGLPVGLQLIGRPRGEAALLGAAALFERATGYDRRVPIEPRTQGEVG
jgi:amidase